MRRYEVMFAVLTALPVLGASHWPQDLYLANGGFWHYRAAVAITNPTPFDVNGMAVSLRVGTQPGELAVVGRNARSFRLCKADGTELLFAVVGPDGARLDDGVVPVGARLYVPAECGAGAETQYWLYWGNAAAGRVPDFLAVAGDLNGGFEQGTGPDPAGWRTKETDAGHRMRWVADDARAGARCVRADVDRGAGPNWVAYHCTRVPLVGGIRYTLQGWVKAAGVKGNAGWFIHLNSDEKSMVGSRHLDAGGGDYDWKKVSSVFVAPTNVTHATIGTVLRGTGTAWFDEVSLDSEEGRLPSAQAGRPEHLKITVEPAASAWVAATGGPWRCRVPVRVVNVGDAVLDGMLCAVRLPGVMAPEGVVVAHGDAVVSHCFVGDTLVFSCGVPAGTVRTYHAYVKMTPAQGGGDGHASALDAWLQQGHPVRAQVASRQGSDIPSDQQVASISAADRVAYERLIGSSANLVKNPSFERGKPLPDGWRNSAGRSSRDFSQDLDSDALFGETAARITWPSDKEPRWVGWHQAVPVKPGQSYLYACWLKCRDFQNSDLQLHAHCLNADGKLCRTLNYTSAGPGIRGTLGWSLCSGRFTMPSDAATFDLHLTMNASGTAWHDGVLFAPTVEGRAGDPETPASPASGGLMVWPVNPLVKVFREDVPPVDVPPLRVTVARNEKEPLQFAVRSSRDVAGVRVTVDPPRNATGQSLNDVAVGVVGYVPIDYPTSYYRSMAPTWHRRIPRRRPGSDGWAGTWPDPILPLDRFDLVPNRTQPVWVTVTVPRDATPGTYAGTLRLSTPEQTLAAVPYVVHVWDLTLPDANHVAAIYDVRFRGEWELPGKSRREALDALLRFMAANRISADRVQAEPRFTMVDGTVNADFGDYDQAAHFYFEALKMPFSYTPAFFYSFGWAHPPKPILGEHPFPGVYPYEDADRTRLRPEYRRVYQACLKLYWDHVKAKGWADKMVLYVSDEPHFEQKAVRDQMMAVCDMIHEVDADIPIYSSTWRHCEDWDGHLDIWGVGHYGCFPKEVMEVRAKAGDRLWITTDGQMCTDTPYCAIERLLPYYCFVHDAQAYEFWGLSWLTYDPYAFGWHSYIRQSSTPGEHYYVRYPNGDGYLLYPGAPVGHDGPVTSLRFEQAREGVEDSEYLFMLRAGLERAASQGRDVVRAQALLDAVARLCAIPNAGGRYSSRILPNPELIPQLKEAVAREVERLSHTSP